MGRLSDLLVALVLKEEETCSEGATGCDRAQIVAASSMRIAHVLKELDLFSFREFLDRSSIGQVTPFCSGSR